MAELFKTVSTWIEARDASERSMLPHPKTPKARFYRQLTVFGDANQAVVAAGHMPSSFFTDMCDEIDNARERAIGVMDDPSLNPNIVHAQLACITSKVHQKIAFTLAGGNTDAKH